MKLYLAIVIFGFLTIFDIGALVFAVPNPALAVIAHLGFVGLGYATMKAFTEPGQKGRRTIAAFSAVLCLITPVLGFIISALILHCFTGRPDVTAAPIDFVVGNPLNAAGKRTTRRIAANASDPLIYAFVHAPSNESHQMAIPLLRHRLDRKAVILLEKLRTAGDARTRLFARSALTSSVENRERALDRLRRKAEISPDDALAHLYLAEMLFASAESGVFGDLQHNSLYHEAGQHFAKAAKIDPKNPAALFGRGMSLIRLNRLDDVPNWYGRLLAVPANCDPDKHGPRLEAELFSASGNWERTRMAAKKIETLATGARRFWAKGGV